MHMQIILHILSTTNQPVAKQLNLLTQIAEKTVYKLRVLKRGNGSYNTLANWREIQCRDIQCEFSLCKREAKVSKILTWWLKAG